MLGDQFKVQCRQSSNTPFSPSFKKFWDDMTISVSKGKPSSQIYIYIPRKGYNGNTKPCKYI